MRSAVSQFDGYVKLNRKIPPEVQSNVNQIEDPVKLADTIAGHLNISLEEKQQLLEILSVGKRLEGILGHMEGEVGALQVEKKIRGRVKRQMEKTQREYYLNEQLKAIQKELGEGEDGSNEILELEERIAQTKLSKEAREKADAAATRMNALGQIGTDLHLQMIDGMVFGDSPRQGIVRGQRFEHGDLALRFDVPRGFALKNAPRRVTARHENQVQIIFDLDARIANETPEAYLRSTWAAGQKLSGFQSLKIDGKSAALGTIKTQTGLAVLLAIDGGTTQIMRFGVLAPRGQNSAAEAAMAALRRSIDFLTPQQAAAIRPYRLRIVTVKQGESVASLARKMRLAPDGNMDKIGLFRVLNGLQDGDVLAAGSRVKLIGD